MTISLTNTGKRFNREWIFRHLNYQFTSGIQYAITGSNGSGKSTLLQVIAGALSASEGTISYRLSANSSDVKDDVYRYISVAAPYIELIEEMTLQEFLLFHQQFKPFLSSLTIDTIINILGLKEATDKQIRYFSSGMKQRVKLAQSFFSDTPVLLLDEPTTNLDADGIALYHQLLQQYCVQRLVIISSNDETEYKFCKEVLRISDYKIAK
ncbi:MAG: ATP-binding cassette domain-containing protein [Agriterribacter sp.]